MKTYIFIALMACPLAFGQINNNGSGGSIAAGTTGQPVVYTSGSAIGSVPQTIDAAECAGADILAKVNSCITALGAGGGTVVIDPGTYNAVTTTATINTPNINILCSGGRGATTINYTGTGDAIRVNMNPFPAGSDWGAGFIEGCTINGTASGLSAIHIGDTVGFTLFNLILTNFTSVSGAGVWFDNQTNWTERTRVIGVHSSHNILQYRFTVNGGTSSFGYSRFLDAECNEGANQTCLNIESGLLYHSTLIVTSNNSAATSTVIHVANGASATDNTYDIRAESTAASALVLVDTGGTLKGSGVIDGQTGAGTMTVTNNGTMNLFGPVRVNDNTSWAGFNVGDNGFRLIQAGTTNAALLPAGWRLLSTMPVGFSTSPGGSANDVAISRTAAGVLAVGTGAAADETGLLRSGNICRITADVSLTVNTANSFCSFSLPAVAKAWAFRCDIQWAITAGSGTNTFALGVNASQTPTGTTNAEGQVYTATTGTQTMGSAAIAASGAINVLTGATYSPVATVQAAKISGTVLASATAGTFAITAAANGTTATAAVKAGSACYLN